MHDVFDGKAVLITGGTGTLGKSLTRHLLTNYNPQRIIIFSRDEYKQSMMRQEFIEFEDKLRFFIGDVRDKDRLLRAFDGVQIVVHAAEMKRVSICEYNPIEAIKSNIMGAMNVIDAAIERKVEKVVALSTDKAVNPVNLYGGTKLVSDKLFVAANAYSKIAKTKFCVVRFGNVAGSRGSVIPFFREQVKNGVDKLPVTDNRMTRFWIDIDQGIELILYALKNARGGETYIPKIPSFRVRDLAKAMSPIGEYEEVGVREGEKLHEVMITAEDARHTLEFENHFVVLPEFDWWKIQNKFYQDGKKLEDGFIYSSDKNVWWLTEEELLVRLEQMRVE